ncbi:MAG: pyridoxal phosphate-dependent aminotransferase [Bacteroidales bacterium]|nr:pyridoxal phosphate-dependent aminotransferase [Bacteroidales bacterium]MBS3774483.1 pyridoxal phosphate-dependent aminotransferase [Bacteroidales bacterium]
MNPTKQTPIDSQTVNRMIRRSGIESVGKASIREIVKLVNEIEKETGEHFTRMEMGVPGLEPPKIAIDGEISALRNGVASQYPMIDGIEPLKYEISRFIKNFLNLSVQPEGCLPTVGAMQASFAAFMVSSRRDPDKDTTLFIDPGFPVQKDQHKVLGLKYENFDVYNYRGDKLRDKLESYLKKGNISTILYSNPNNPSWICLNEKELKTIGELATKYNAIVLEDLAYFGMDFRHDISTPGEPPYQPTVANYTDNYVLIISSSKSFSLAGERIGMMVISDYLFNKDFPGLKHYFPNESFGYSMIYGALYSLSAGANHSAQYGLLETLKAVNEGRYNFVEGVREYAERAKAMKRLFRKHGFELVYAKDEDQPVSDGFYFTFSFPGMEGSELLGELIYYGISAITLDITGSERTEGLRACVSQVSLDQMDDLEYRLKRFQEDHLKSV